MLIKAHGGDCQLKRPSEELQLEVSMDSKGLSEFNCFQLQVESWQKGPLPQLCWVFEPLDLELPDGLHKALVLDLAHSERGQQGATRDGTILVLPQPARKEERQTPKAPACRVINVPLLVPRFKNSGSVASTVA